MCLEFRRVLFRSPMHNLFHHLADEIRGEGKEPTLDLIVERFVTGVADHDKYMRAAPGQDIGAEQSQDGRPSQGNGTGSAAQGRSAPTPISNDLASSSASNPRRRKTLEERQRDADAMLYAPTRPRR